MWEHGGNKLCPPHFGCAETPATEYVPVLRLGSYLGSKGLL